MIDTRIYQIISMLDGMRSEDQDAAIKQLIKHYASKSVDNTMLLMSLIPEISQTQVSLLSKSCMENYQAAEWLVNLRTMKFDKKDSSAYFAAMVPAAKALFVRGTSEGASGAKQEFFKTFIDLYKKEFSWDRDRSWAESFGYSEFFKLLDKNIQEGKI
ncbi:MAG: hypothetical protein NC548_39825 [Lachnospiraceae bacterium]|nr:hypothetical protein [Lachnospiraceae bacterium]